MTSVPQTGIHGPVTIDIEDFYGAPFAFIRDGDGNILLSEAHSAFDHDELLPKVRAMVAAANSHASLLECLHAAKLAMIAFGNEMNWPPETPQAYADAINRIRAALAAAGETT